ncbi:MAG TPA: hypothetical protein VIP57_01230 [Candidatus Dormibacteraeota bacterium]|jgi:hypothetical protein
MSQEVSRDQFAWGLSNGITVLTISGVFWLSLGAWTTSFGGLFVALPPILLVGGILIWANVGLRRRFPKFSPRNLRGAPKGSQTRKIILGFYAVTAAQWLSIVMVGGICTALNRSDLIWPLIGLVTSLHFLPLGWLFGVRPYYLLAVIGTVITLVSIVGFTDGLRLVAVGLGLGLLMIAGATYLIANADSLVGAGTVPPSQPASGK